MNKQEKIELGRLLDKYRVLTLHYFAKDDVYLMRYLNSRDEEAPEEIKGEILG